MAINLNHVQYGSQFQEFVNLAARNAGDPNTIVCLDDREQGRAPDQLLGPNGEARLISVKTGDTIKPLLGARFGRSADNKALNNQIRNLFLETVLKVCGVQTKEQLPEAIRKAMKINDYDNKGHPLTVRRITAVKAAIEAKLNADAAVALREIKTMLNKQVVEGGNANEDECAARAQTLVDATKGDADLLNLLTKKDCALAREIMCKGSKGEILCSDEEVTSNMANCRNAINEIRVATNGNEALYKRSLGRLGDFVKHPLQAGQIRDMAATVQGLDLGPVTDCLLAPGHAKKFEAICLVQKMVNSAIARAGVQVDEEGEAGQEKLSASYYFLYDIIFARLSRHALENLRDSMYNEEFLAGFRTACDISGDDWEGPGDEEPQLKAEIKEFAQSISYVCAYGLVAAVRDALNGKSSDYKGFINLPEVDDNQRNQFYAQFKGIVQAEDLQPNL